MFQDSEKKLVPDNIRDLKPYVAGKTIAEVQEAYDPPRISKLASNENRLGCSPVVKSAVNDALEEIQNYPDPISRKLRAKLAKENGVEEENIIIAAGSESIIANLCRTFFGEGEEAITADATFVGFFVHANIHDVSMQKIPVTEEYKFDLSAMAEAVTDRTKMIYIANPNNPTGTYITKDEFESFMNQVPSDVIVIMDEAYYEYANDIEDYPSSVDYSYDNVLTLRTFSKAYGLAGFRLGYAIGHKELIGNMMKTKLTFEPTALAQAAANAALKDKGFLQESVHVVEEGKKRLYDFLESQDAEYIRSISNSVVLILENEQEAIDFTEGMLEKGVILRRINAFGLPNCIRITIGTEEDMQHFEQAYDEYYSTSNN